MCLNEIINFCRKHLVPTADMSIKDLYEGFSMDLIDNVANMLKFKYKVTVVDATVEYGKENAKTKKWSGIIGKIVSKVRENLNYPLKMPS